MLTATIKGGDMEANRASDNDLTESAAKTIDDVVAPLPPQPNWPGLIPEEDWAVYKAAIDIAHSLKVPFLLGGAFGLAAYTHRWRNTKDLDLLVLPADRDRLVEGLSRAGFQDYYPTLPYDRGWIYRSTRDGCIVDVIFAMANRRAEITADWFPYGRKTNIRGEVLRAVGAEELLWQKVYVVQRDRCDWPDLFNLIYAAGPELDWDRVLQRFDTDAPLLAGLLSVFTWLCPGHRHLLPDRIRERFHLPDAAPDGGASARCLSLLDSRPWFAALQPDDRPLQL
jgi:hypothetical protein